MAKGSEIQSYRAADGRLVTEQTRRLIDPETGEEVWLQGVERVYFGQKHFWKMYLFDFLQILGVIESRQLDVICYIMENTDTNNNIFMGTQQQIADAVGCSRTTVSETIQKLKAANFLTNGRIKATYIINPDVMVKGHETKKRGLMITYREHKNAETYKAAKRMDALDPDDSQLKLEFDSEGIARVGDDESYKFDEND